MSFPSTPYPTIRAKILPVALPRYILLGQVGEVRWEVLRVEVLEESRFVLEHVHLVLSPLVDERVNDRPKHPEDPVAVDDEEGLQALWIVLLPRN